MGMFDYEYHNVGVLVDTRKLGEGNTLEDYIQETIIPYKNNFYGECPDKYLEYDSYEDKDKEGKKEVVDRYNKIKSEGFYRGNFEDYLFDFYEYEKNEYTGKHELWYNPRSVWAKCEILNGGNETKILKNKKGKWVDRSKLKDIDWEGVKERLEDYSAKYWDGDTDDIIGIELFGAKEYETRESYIEKASEFEIESLIDLEKEWHFWNDGYIESTEESVRENYNKREKSFHEMFLEDVDEEVELVIISCLM